MWDPVVALLMWCLLGGVYVWLLWRGRDMPRFWCNWCIGFIIVSVGGIIYNGIKVLELLGKAI